MYTIIIQNTNHDQQHYTCERRRLPGVEAVHNTDKSIIMCNSNSITINISNTNINSGTNTDKSIIMYNSNSMTTNIRNANINSGPNTSSDSNSEAPASVAAFPEYSFNNNNNNSY